VATCELRDKNAGVTKVLITVANPGNYLQSGCHIAAPQAVPRSQIGMTNYHNGPQRALISYCRAGGGSGSLGRGLAPSPVYPN